MKAIHWFHLPVSLGLAVMLFWLTALPSVYSAETGKASFRATGLFLDSCSCSAPCGCELVGLAHGCQGVGALVLTSGKYNGTDLAGAKIAYATVPGKWVRLYVETKTPEQRTAVEAFGRAAFAGFGKIQSVRPASVVVTGSGGRYTLAVDGGKVMTMTMEPVLGGDKKRPVAIGNTQNRFASTFLQAKTVHTVFHDGGQKFTLKGSNAYYQDNMKAKGDL